MHCTARKEHGDAAPVAGACDADYTTTLTIARVGTPAFPTIPPKMTITTAARWIGACKARQKPGDIVLPDGSKTNIRAVIVHYRSD